MWVRVRVRVCAWPSANGSGNSGGRGGSRAWWVMAEGVLCLQMGGGGGTRAQVNGGPGWGDLPTVEP